MARSATKSQKPAAEPPLGRKDWIAASITMLAEDNVEALRVDTLAEKLGVTKGSFYWHFKGRDDLLSAVLDEWQLRMTSEIQSLILDRSGTPWERLERLLRIAISGRPDVPGGPFEITLRDWARRDPKVAKVVRAVDQSRPERSRCAGLCGSAYGRGHRHPDDPRGQRGPGRDQAPPPHRRRAAAAARAGRKTAIAAGPGFSRSRECWPISEPTTRPY
jgi:AcrR family transcriptional regulator